MRAADALILLCKAPFPGLVKTRLAPLLGGRGAASFYRCLLEDSAEEMSRVGGVSHYLFYTPDSAASAFARAPFTRFRRLPQRGGGLGERMARAVDVALLRGARRVVLVGADCPALGAPRVRAALRELADGAGAVFGPARDGGFYLAGFTGPVGPLFRGVAWGTGEVLAAVAERCRRGGIRYSLLPSESDIDTPGDVAAFARWSESHRTPPCRRSRRRVSALTSPRGSATAPPRGRRSRFGRRSPGSPSPAR